MQKYKQAAVSIAFLTIILSGGLSSGVLSTRNSDGYRKAYEQQEKILMAFEDEDYDSWKKFISKRSPVYSAITKKEFEEFVAARKAARSGEYEKAIALAEKVEIDLKNKLGEEYFG